MSCEFCHHTVVLRSHKSKLFNLLPPILHLSLQIGSLFELEFAVISPSSGLVATAIQLISFLPPLLHLSLQIGSLYELGFAVISPNSILIAKATQLISFLLPTLHSPYRSAPSSSLTLL